MITTSTGAKKLESSDNWREIFPNPGTSAAGAHNASVDAQDRIQAEVAPIINGKRCSLGAASGDYVLLRNSTIAGKTDGAYVATKAIPANTDLDSTYLGSPITGGLMNELNSNLTILTNKRIRKKTFSYTTGGFGEAVVCDPNEVAVAVVCDQGNIIGIPYNGRLAKFINLTATDWQTGLANTQVTGTVYYVLTSEIST